MEQTKEISALFTLIDDPDEEVFSSVSQRIVDYGKGIIPNLESLWEVSPSDVVQDRVEMIIHKLHFEDLKNDLQEWKNKSYHDLLWGALLICKFQYPDLRVASVLQEIERIRRNIWLELNTFLNPLEQANVIASILYNYYKLGGEKISYKNPDEFFISSVLQSKKGNAISNGVLYLILSELLGLEVKAIKIPNQFVVAFFQTDYTPLDVHTEQDNKIFFFVDPTNGMPLSHNDISNYFRRIGVEALPEYFKPQSSLQVLITLTRELARCFTSPDKMHKHNELMELVHILEG